MDIGDLNHRQTLKGKEGKFPSKSEFSPLSSLIADYASIWGTVNDFSYINV